MSKIILDFGSGNSCKNNIDTVIEMIDNLKLIDTGKHEIIIKWQLFERAGLNVPLSRHIFRLAYDYAKKLGYKTTASVFDLNSLEYLLKFDIPFVKIANNRNLDYLIDEIPRRIPVYVSSDNIDCFSVRNNLRDNMVIMSCISSYPASLIDYEKNFRLQELHVISDHTVNFELFKRYNVEIIEWHYVLKHDISNLDGGLFARTPSQLKGVL